MSSRTDGCERCSSRMNELKSTPLASDRSPECSPTTRPLTSIQAYCGNDSSDSLRPSPARIGRAYDAQRKGAWAPCPLALESDQAAPYFRKVWNCQLLVGAVVTADQRGGGKGRTCASTYAGPLIPLRSGEQPSDRRPK